MKDIEVFAPAKITWSLDIAGRRADGYHLLCALMQEISLKDRVRLQLSAYDEMLCFPSLPDDSDNLAMRAWKMLREKFGIRDCLHISIEKNIPVGGGLAGGSSNAAAVIKAANEMFKLGMTTDDMCGLGLLLGADLPFCISGGFALVEGIGEKLTPLMGKKYNLVIINQGIPVSTAQVYKNFSLQSKYQRPDIEKLIKVLSKGSISEVAALCGNALEAPALMLHPEIAVIKEFCSAMGQAVLMSGSGGSVWVLTESEAHAEDCAKELKLRFPFVQVVHTII